MTSTNPRGKKRVQTNILSEFPSLTVHKPSPTIPRPPSPRSKYEEIQKDELIALASIYGEDFRHLPSTRGAWNKFEPCFEIYIKSSDKDLAVTLNVTLTASYPKSPPLLILKGDEHLREGTRFKLQRVIENKPKELVADEQAMIMEIVNACLDVLQDAADIKSAGGKILSLEEERAAYKAAALKQAQEEEELVEKKKRLEALEEERVQETLLQVEIDRQRTKARETKRMGRLSSNFVTHSSIGLDDAFSFEQPITILDGDGNPCLFQLVNSKFCIRRGPISTCSTVRPVTSKGVSHLPMLVLKQTRIIEKAEDKSFKVNLQHLEFDLKSLKKIKHRNLLEILGFEIHKTLDNDGESKPSWNISILTEYAEKGSLREFIDISGHIGLEKVRSWTIELLDALQFLHENGVIHQDLNLGNILLVRSLDGEVHPKLADASYQRRLHDLYGQKHNISTAKATYWAPPEISISSSDHPDLTQKTDIWDFGILFLQMIFGLSVIQLYTSPTNLIESLPLSVSLNEFVLKIFKLDPSKRPRAVELSPSEFLATDAPVLESFSANLPQFGSTTLQHLSSSLRNRHDLAGGAPLQRSRYREDFVGEGRIGKGGFGEVVKARKKLDGQIYAIKKIIQKSSASLTEILKEVRLLSQLSHPSVVRYYNTWTEEISDDSGSDDETSDSEISSSNISREATLRTGSGISFCVSTGGLDFMSSSRYSQKDFGYEDTSTSDEENVDEDSDEDSTCFGELDSIVEKAGCTDLNTSSLRSEKKLKRPRKIALYISMEYCEKQTLRDLIKRELYKDDPEIWRLFRQILEGLVHIHGLNIVHRDLKPENVFIDAASNVKIGDFGLATSGQYTMTEKASSAHLNMSGNMTQGVGTAFYVAPEVNSTVKGSYTSKVDMYSLGMIFFEMCFRPLIPGMDRAKVSEGLRNKQPEFPTEFKVLEKPHQVEIILSLLNHSAGDRPSSSELLRSGKLPLQMENETIKQALIGLADPKSPYYEKILKTFFSIQNDRARDYAWDMGSISYLSCDLLLLRGIVKQKLIEIFRHHGAIETTRTALFPCSTFYGPNVVQLLDKRGTVLQLPYDLTLPHARDIAKHQPVVERSFAFDRVFRDRDTGGQPLSVGEVDFDIVSSNKLDFSLKEAEVIKVLDEITESFPSLSSSQMCFQVNHSDFLRHIFDFCRIEPNKRLAVTDTLSKLNMQSWTWQKIQLELRSPHIGLSAPSIDDLQRFDFRDTLEKSVQKLKALFEGTDFFEKASLAISHIRDVIIYARRFEVKRKIFITPLGSLNEKFYKGGIFFSCVFDRKPKDVFAAGGRYDSLIRDHSRKTGNQVSYSYAVGFNLAWEKIARIPKAKTKGFIKKADEENYDIWNTKRCDVLVASHDATILRTEGINLLKILWSHSISAELAQDSHSPEDLLSKCREDHHAWIVIIKQDSILKVKSMNRKETNDVDIPSTQLLSYLKSEIRERDRRTGAHQRGKSRKALSSGETGNEQDVRILLSGTKHKKLNRGNIVEQAQTHALSLTQEMLDGPIAAIETTDQVMELIRNTKLNEPETWRTALNSVSNTEKKYMGEVYDLLLKIKEQNLSVTRNAFIYNFKTGNCVYYDLGE